MEDSPLLSIQCLVYNHEPFLRQCLDGFVMQQTTFPFEAIVHDDASTDGSAAIIREYAEKYPDIIKPIYETENQYHKHDASIGRAIRAVMHPDTKYIAECEGDDYWTDPLKLQKQVDILETHPDCTIVFCKVKTITKDGNPRTWTIPCAESRIPCGEITLDDYMKEEYYYARWTFHTSAFCYRKSCLELHNQLRSTLYRNFPFGDQPLLLSCLFQGKGFYIPDYTGCYRTGSGGFFSTVKKSTENQIHFYEKYSQACDDLNEYTKGRFAVAIKRRKDLLYYNILKLRYDNHLMSRSQRFLFPIYTLWKVRRSFSSIKLSFAEFLSCFSPDWYNKYLGIRNYLNKI